MLIADASLGELHRFPMALTTYLVPVVAAEPIVSILVFIVITALTYFAEADRKNMIIVPALFVCKLIILWLSSTTI